MSKSDYWNNTLEVLGSKSSRLSIITSVCFAGLSFFYVYAVGSFFKITVYQLADRVRYVGPFNLHIVNEYVDNIIIGSLLILWLVVSIRNSRFKFIAIALLGVPLVTVAAINNSVALNVITLLALPTIVSLLVYDRYAKRILINQSNDLTINYLAVTGIIIGTIAFILVIAPVFDNSLTQSLARNYAYEIFVLVSGFSPILILILIASFPSKILINALSDFFRRTRSATETEEIRKEPISTRKKMIYLAAFASLSIVITLIPHFPTVNENSQLVGVDTLQYANWMTELGGTKDFQELLHKAFVEILGGDRPLSLFFLFFFQQAATFGDNNPAEMIEYVVVILGPSLVVVVYFLTRELTQNDRMALLAALLTPLSFQILIGVYSGFYSNWFALIVGYLSFVFFFRFLRQGRRRDLVLYGVLTTLTLFIHVYTWSILAIVAGVFLAATLITNHGYGTRRTATLLLIALLGTVAVDAMRVGLTGSSGGLESDLRIAENRVGLDQFVSRWNNLTYTTMVYVGGLFANFVILGLGIYWLIKSNKKDLSTIFLITFLSVGILPFLFGDWIIQTRVFYDIPFQIPAALAVFYIMKRKGTGVMRTTPILLWLVWVSILLAANFYLVLPS